MSKPLLGQELNASGMQFSQNNSSHHGKVVQHSKTNSKDIQMDDENQYRSYYEKESNQDKLKIISEDFIDGLIDKRKKMADAKNVQIYNEKTKGLKNNLKNENRIPNVASISDKKASKFLHNGSQLKNKTAAGYTFSSSAAKDQKTLNH